MSQRSEEKPNGPAGRFDLGFGAVHQSGEKRLALRMLSQLFILSLVALSNAFAGPPALWAHHTRSAVRLSEEPQTAPDVDVSSAAADVKVLLNHAHDLLGTSPCS